MIKLLVVDDEPGICDILKKTFGAIGFVVFTANSGVEALEIVKKDKPRIVFLDVRMSGMSGLEILQEVKLIDKGIRAVMVTALDDAKIREEAKQLGADDFVTKPFMSDYLEEVVRRQVAALLED